MIFKMETPTMFLLGEKKIYEAVQPTALDGLDVVAANPDLVGVEIELVDMPQREYRLKRVSIGS